MSPAGNAPWLAARKGWFDVAVSLIASLAIVSVVVVALGADPFVVFRTIVDSSLGNTFAFGQTMTVASILVLTGLAAAVPFSAHMWNVGGEGQLFFGAFVAYAASRLVSGLPGVALPMAVLLAGALGGAAWGLVPGLLKVKAEANEVITSLMMSFIAILVGAIAVNDLWPEGFGAQTEAVPAHASLPTVFPSLGLSIAVPIAVAAGVLTWVLIAHTRIGFGIRAAGLNGRAARAGGIDVRRLPVITFAYGGACAGIAGAVAVVGVNGAFVQNFSQNYGFLGIAVALLGRLSGLWILPSAMLFAVLTVGANGLEVTTGLSPDVGQILGGILVILLVALHVIKLRYPEGGDR